jgi:hypothetical protein
MLLRYEDCLLTKVHARILRQPVDCANHIILNNGGRCGIKLLYLALYHPLQSSQILFNATIHPDDLAENHGLIRQV